MHFVRVCECATSLIHLQSLILPGIPKTGHNLHGLVCLIVSAIVVQVALETEILGLRVVQRGDHVPSRPAFGEVINGGKYLVVDGIHRNLLGLLPGFLRGGIKRDVDLALGNAKVG